MKLYSYDHCPYCTRVRMIIGDLDLPIDTVFLANDDEKTPIDLIGKKIVPILIKADNQPMAESLDIVAYLDENYGKKLVYQTRPEVQGWIDRTKKDRDALTWPRAVKIGLPEFLTQSAIDYFVSKKSPIIGDFTENLNRTESILARLNNELPELALLLQTRQHTMSMEDIILFPLLRNLTSVKSMVWDKTITHYLHEMSDKTRVDLFSDRAI